MSNNNLTDEQLEELLSELETCGIYGRQVRALYELQQYRKGAEQRIRYFMKMKWISISIPKSVRTGNCADNKSGW